MVRAIRAIDEVENRHPHSHSPNYDESDDDDDKNSGSGDNTTETLSVPVSDSLPEENNEEINLEVPELKDILSDTPVEYVHVGPIACVENPADEEEEGGEFVLQAWA